MELNICGNPFVYLVFTRLYLLTLYFIIFMKLPPIGKVYDRGKRLLLKNNKDLPRLQTDLRYVPILSNSASHVESTIMTNPGNNVLLFNNNNLKGLF